MIVDRARPNVKAPSRSRRAKLPGCVELNAGMFASYGCAPIDLTYWMSGSGMSVTVTFVAPQSQPSIRVGA